MTSSTGADHGSTEDYERQLARIPLFLDLSKRELHRLAATCVERDYAAGDVLVRQDEPGVGLFILISGSVKVTQHQGSGEDIELNTLKAGDVFGELSLLGDQPRTATVTALEPVRALLMPIFDFRAALREDPDITIRLLGVVSRRLRHQESRYI